MLSRTTPDVELHTLWAFIIANQFLIDPNCQFKYCPQRPKSLKQTCHTEYLTHDAELLEISNAWLSNIHCKFWTTKQNRGSNYIVLRSLLQKCEPCYRDEKVMFHAKVEKCAQGIMQRLSYLMLLYRWKSSEDIGKSKKLPRRGGFMSAPEGSLSLNRKYP